MSNPIGERNLLFGILALDKKYISGDTLAEAMKRWSLAKKKDLAQILRELTALSENQHALLEESIDNLIKQHGNDVSKSLASLWLVGPARQELEKIADPDVQGALAKVAVEPIEVAEAIDVEEAIVDYAVAQPIRADPSVKRQARPPARPRRPRAAPPSSIPAWVLIACGLAVVLLMAVVGGGGLLLFVFLTLAPVAGGVPDVEPIAEARVEDFPIQPIDPLVVAPPVFVPPVKGKDRPPIGPGNEMAKIQPPLPTTPGFVPLFNGKDLTGWRPHKQNPEIWRVENGILIGDGLDRKTGRLTTENPQPKDFHLRVEARVGAKTMGNICFRCPGDSLFGYNTDFRFLGGKLRVGGLGVQAAKMGRGFPRVVEPAMAPGRWFTLEVIAQGSHFIVKVDGVTTTDLTDTTQANPGYIALNQFGPTPIEFRRIEIKALAPAAEGLPIAKAGAVLARNSHQYTGAMAPDLA